MPYENIGDPKVTIGQRKQSCQHINTANRIVALVILILMAILIDYMSSPR